MITQVARTDGLALRAGRPRALGIGRTKDSKSECDERAYTYQQGSLKGDLGNSSLRCPDFIGNHAPTIALLAQYLLLPPAGPLGLQFD
jgi:hypothetical protein